MAEQRQPFRFRIPWLPGTSVPPRAPAEATRHPVTEAPAAVERIPFQLSARPPFRPAGIALVPPPPKVPSSPPAEQLVGDKKPTEPLAPAPVPDLAKSYPPQPPSLELKALSPPLLENSSLTTVAQPLQPKETSLPESFVQQVADEKPAKPIDSATVPNLAAANPPEPTPLVPKVLPPASQERSSFSSISRPSGESQGPLGGIISKLQKNKHVEATDQEEAPTEAVGSVANSKKEKEKETTHPPALPPVPGKQPKGPLPSASASQEPKRSKQMKIVPKRHAATSSYYQSNTNHLVSRPRPAAVRGSGSSSSSSSFHKEIKDDVSKLVHLITSGKENTSTIQNSVEVITLAGENTGATMQLTSKSSERNELIHIHGTYRSNLDESIGGMTDVEEEEREVNGEEGEEESENSAFLNSNVQGLNNSIVVDSSVSEGSPGVYFERAQNAEMQLESHTESHKEEMPRRTSQ